VGASAAIVALFGASVLLWAGLEKARNPAATVSTLRQLGVPTALANAAGLVVAAEVAVALALVFRPGSGWTHAAVAGLAGAFALAGVVALRKEERIRCTCFGSGTGGYLGTSQIAALVPWLGGVAFLSAADPPDPSAARAASTLAAIALAMALLRLGSLASAWREARADRVTARETYRWARR
jgi:hypothetical protein